MSNQSSLSLPLVGSYTFQARPFLCDHTFQLFMAHLGNALLNASDYHSHERGFGVSRLQAQHRTWVLSRLAIEMEQMPRAYDTYTVETWVPTAKRFFTSRFYRVVDAQGKMMGQGQSIWAMIDTETRQPVDLNAVSGENDTTIMNYLEPSRQLTMSPPSRVAVPADAELKEEVKTHYSDVDINGHINSMKYVEHVLNCFDTQWWRHHSIARLDVAFVAEAHAGDCLRIYGAQTAPLTHAFRLTRQADNEEHEVEVCRCEMVVRMNEETE